MNIETALKEALSVSGAVGAALVDYESGMALGTLGGGDWLDLDTAAAGLTWTGHGAAVARFFDEVKSRGIDARPEWLAMTQRVRGRSVQQGHALALQLFAALVRARGAEWAGRSELRQ